MAEKTVKDITAEQMLEATNSVIGTPVVCYLFKRKDGTISRRVKAQDNDYRAIQNGSTKQAEMNRNGVKDYMAILFSDGHLQMTSTDVSTSSGAVEI